MSNSTTHHPLTVFLPFSQENLVWVPALQDSSNKNRPATRQSGSRSSSQPPLSRVPHPMGNGDHLEPPMTAHPRPRAPTPTKPISNSIGQPDAFESQRAQYEIPQYQRKRPSSAGAHHHYYHPEPRRKSDEYIGYEGPRSGRSSVPVDRADRYASHPDSFGLRSATMDSGAQHRYRLAQATVGGRSVQRSQTLPMNFSIPEDRQANGPYGLNITHTVESVDEEEDQRTEMAKSKNRVLKWLEQSSAALERASPTKRRTADGYEHLRSPGREQAVWESPSQGRHQFYGHSRDDMARKEALGRNHSLPAAFAPGVVHMTEMNDITEEPSDMISRTLVEDFSSEGNSEQDNDNESEMFRPVLQRQKTPLPTQRPPLDRNDTLRVDDERAYHQPLPSPKSLHPSSGQSSRIPSARSSYERVGEGGRVATPNRHHLSPASSQQFQGAMSYNTPPRTPNRPDYMYRQDESRAPMSAPAAIRNGAYSAPNAAAEPSPLRHADRNGTRSGGAHPSPGSFQTPPHLQYLYRQSASPSPQVRQPASAASNPGHHTLQSQYGHGASLSAEKSLPPRPTRSPSPRPPSVVPLAPQTTGHHSSSRSQHGGTPTRQADQTQDQIGSRSGAHGRSPLAPRPQLSGSGRHVRSGFWNRRGDHLTKDGYVVSCPPGRNYPPELSNYPDLGFMDHLGNRVAQTPDKFPEHPDSVPANGRPAKTPYEHVRLVY